MLVGRDTIVPSGGLYVLFLVGGGSSGVLYLRKNLSS